MARTSLLIPPISLSFSFSPSILIAKAFIQIISFDFTLLRSNNKIYTTLGKSKEKEEQLEATEGQEHENEHFGASKAGTKRLTYNFCYDNVNFRQETRE